MMEEAVNQIFFLKNLVLVKHYSFQKLFLIQFLASFSPLFSPRLPPFFEEASFLALSLFFRQI